MVYKSMVGERGLFSSFCALGGEERLASIGAKSVYMRKGGAPRYKACGRR